MIEAAKKKKRKLEPSMRTRDKVSTRTFSSATFSAPCAAGFCTKPHPKSAPQTERRDPYEHEGKDGLLDPHSLAHLIHASDQAGGLALPSAAGSRVDGLRRREDGDGGASRTG